MPFTGTRIDAVFFTRKKRLEAPLEKWTRVTLSVDLSCQERTLAKLYLDQTLGGTLEMLHGQDSAYAPFSPPVAELARGSQSTSQGVRRNGFAHFLADDMGLGNTIHALARPVHFKRACGPDRPALAVAGVVYLHRSGQLGNGCRPLQHVLQGIL